MQATGDSAGFAGHGAGEEEKEEVSYHISSLIAKPHHLS